MLLYSIGDAGADALHRAIRESNTTLTSLNVANNHLSPYLVSSINTVLAANRERCAAAEAAAARTINTTPVLWSEPSDLSSTSQHNFASISAAGSGSDRLLPAIASASAAQAAPPSSDGPRGSVVPNLRRNHRFQEAFLDPPTKRRTTQLTLNKYGCDLAR